jgi:hypothetical protein
MPNVIHEWLPWWWPRTGRNMSKWCCKLIKKVSYNPPEYRDGIILITVVRTYTLDINNFKNCTCEVNHLHSMPVLSSTCKDWKVSFPIAWHSTFLVVELAALDLQDVCPSADCETNLVWTRSTVSGSVCWHTCPSTTSPVSRTQTTSLHKSFVSHERHFSYGQFLAEFCMRSALKSAISLL